MCGILGYLNNPVDERKFTAALNTMTHRGPDGHGVWQSDTASLGHRRLAIIDTSDSARQPMELLDRYLITFNGEIYNYLELKKELLATGIGFKTNSDTEVLLQAYLTWGTNCLHKLNGMWAFAIWDKTERSLFMSRDRLGKKPLFYAQVNGSFIFSSEMKGIYPFLDSVEMNTEVVDRAIADSFSYEHTDKCLVKNISRFPAGSYGVYRKDTGLKIQRFWDPMKHTSPVSQNYGEQVEQFRYLFLDACKLRMQSDVTIGTALSGGLDSSSVICAMDLISKSNSANIQKDWQHAFVAAFPGTSLDETTYAQTVVDHIGIKSQFVNIDPLAELNDIYRQAYMFEELYYAPTIPFVQLYRNIKQAGVTVSIDGHGADELFAGYPFDMNSALPDALPDLRKFKEVLATINESSGLPLKHDYSNKLKFALLNKYPLLQRFAKNPNVLKKKGKLGFLNSLLFESTYETILPVLLRNYDRYSMMNSVEIRMPFLDHRILQFAFSIPYSSKIRNGFSKAIVRDALKDILPPEIRERKSKIGFNSPMHVWMGGTLKEWIGDTVNSQDFKNSSLVDPGPVKATLLKTLEAKELSYSEGERSFAMIMPYIWEKSLKLHHES